MFLVQGICPPNPITQLPGWLWDSGERIVNIAWLKKVQGDEVISLPGPGFRGKRVHGSGLQRTTTNTLPKEELVSKTTPPQV